MTPAQLIAELEAERITRTPDETAHRATSRHLDQAIHTLAQLMAEPPKGRTVSTLTTDERIELIARYRADEPMQDIAAALGISKNRVDHLRRAMGEPVRARTSRVGHHARPPSDPDAYAAEIARDLDAGLTPAEIAADRGVQAKSIARRLARGGHDDLAARFYAVDSRSGTCAECGGTTHARSDQCRDCRRKAAAAAAREARQAAEGRPREYDDLESPRSIQGWKRVNRGGIVRWVKPEQAIA